MVAGDDMRLGGSTSIVGGGWLLKVIWGVGSPWWQYRAWWNQVGSFDSPQQWVLRLKGIKVKDKVRYESFSDVGEIRVWFASKILTPCRMH